MSTGPTFDVVLFGYRNDLARARTLEFLSQLPASQAGPAPLDRDASVPQRVFSGIDLNRARRIVAQLSLLGAQAALLPVDVGPGAQRAAGMQEQADVPPPAARRAGPPFTLLLVLALGGAAYLAHVTEPMRAPRPARLPAITELAPVPAEAPDDPPAAARLNADALTLAESRQFREAVQRLQAALRLAPDDPQLTQNLQATLFNWAITALNAGQLDEAGDRLRQAAELGDRVEVLRALGITYARQTNYEQAAVTLEQALRLRPKDQETLLALAEVYVQRDRRPEALDMLQRAREAGAGGPELERRVQQLSREVDAEWDFVESQSAHFRVSFGDDQDTRAVRLVLDALETAYYAVGSKLATYPDGRTLVVLYTQQDFHAVTQTPDWAGAAFDGRIKIPVRGLEAGDPNLAHIIQHEYAHSVIGQITGGHCPAWLNEGLAVWAEEEQDGERVRWAESKISDQVLFPLEALNGSFTKLPPGRVGVAYAQSYLAVHALIDRYGARTIPVLLSALHRTPDLRDAFAATYPADLAGFERQLMQQLTSAG